MASCHSLFLCTHQIPWKQLQRLEPQIASICQISASRKRLTGIGRANLRSKTNGPYIANNQLIWLLVSVSSLYISTRHGTVVTAIWYAYINMLMGTRWWSVSIDGYQILGGYRVGGQNRKMAHQRSNRTTARRWAVREPTALIRGGHQTMAEWSTDRRKDL